MSVLAEMTERPAPPTAPAPGAAMRTAEANRQLFATHARDYDDSEHCVAHAGPRRLLEELLDRAIGACGNARPRTLDACGGTGNVSELLHRRGVSTTLVDVSPEMLARWREKAARLGADADTVEGEIDVFLGDDEREWDLIVFSSALHHLDDYVSVSELAWRRLAPGGVLVTAFDPIRADDRPTRLLRRFDYLLFLATRPRALAAAVARRARRRSEGGVNVGDLAERHALDGVDDVAVARALEAAGAEIVEHRRYACQRFRLTERIIRATRRATTFHLIARKPGPQVVQATPSE